MLVLLSALALARPPTGETQVIVVMKSASCGVCAEQLRLLSTAEMPARLMGITHDSSAAAAKASSSTGVSVYSHAPGIEAMGLMRRDLGIATPAVVVYDQCGEEVGRLVGRTPGVDATASVRQLVDKANAVKTCGKPQS